MKTILLWIATLGLIVGAQIIGGGHVGSLMQSTAALLVFPPLAFYLVYAVGTKGMIGFIQRLLSTALTQEDAQIIDTTATLGFLFGGIGSIIGIIHVMENLADTSRLGAGIATAFVSVVYGAVPAILLLPVKSHAHDKTESGSSDMIKKAAGFTAASFIMLMFSLFVVLYATKG